MKFSNINDFMLLSDLHLYHIHNAFIALMILIEYMARTAFYPKSYSIIKSNIYIYICILSSKNK